MSKKTAKEMMGELHKAEAAFEADVRRASQAEEDLRVRMITKHFAVPQDLLADLDLAAPGRRDFTFVGMLPSRRAGKTDLLKAPIINNPPMAYGTRKVGAHVGHRVDPRLVTRYKMVDVVDTLNDSYREVWYKGKSIKIDRYLDGRAVDKVIDDFVQSVEAGTWREESSIEEIRRDFQTELNRRMDAMAVAVRQEVEKLEKQIKTMSFEPRFERAAHLNDMATWISEDEELLAEGYRGWPTVKERTVF